MLEADISSTIIGAEEDCLQPGSKQSLPMEYALRNNLIEALVESGQTSLGIRSRSCKGVVQSSPQDLGWHNWGDWFWEDHFHPQSDLSARPDSGIVSVLSGTSGRVILLTLLPGTQDVPPSPWR